MVEDDNRALADRSSGGCEGGHSTFDEVTAWGFRTRKTETLRVSSHVALSRTTLDLTRIEAFWGPYVLLVN